MGDRSPSPPIDRRVSSLRRRSSMGHSVRKSRSIIGLPFEDQIAAISTTASIEQKLMQIVATSWSTAARLVQHEYDNQEACEDNPQADLVDHIRNEMARKPISVKHENLMSVKDMIGQMAKECEQKKPQKIMPPRLKKLTEALNLATNESDQWKELHHSRKNQYNMAKVEKRQVLQGEKIVSNKNRGNLPKSEEAWLRGLTDGHDEWKKVQEQEKALFMAKKGLHLQLAQKRKVLADLEAEINVVGNKIRIYSEKISTDIPKTDLLCSPPKSGDFTLS